MDIDRLKDIAKKYALKNAHDYGKARVDRIIGKVVAEMPECKEDMEGTISVIQEMVKEVNALSREEIEEKLKGYQFVKRREERRWNLPGAEEGKVVTRFLPEPNGYAHIGHAKAAWLSHEFARQWKGICILRFDDTNPEKEKAEYVDAIRRDLSWLGLIFERESYTSDMMPLFYEYAEKLIEHGDAYVCTCDVNTMRRNRKEMKECECRKRGMGDNMRLWNGMRNGDMKRGEAVLRLAGDMKSLNTVMRDPTLFRIMDAPHYRQGDKYKVWPTYDFEVSIADSIDGVTHALRSKEYELRDELYYYILDKLGLRKPYVYDFARLNIKGTLLSKRYLKPLIDMGKVGGWDDPRLPTIMGLRRRGILPEAIRRFVLSFGLGKIESEPTWDILLTENKKLLDPITNHYFFVPDPVKVVVERATGETVKLKKNPADLSAGFREIKTGDVFYIPKNDAEEIAVGETFRLKDLYNVKVMEKGAEIRAVFAGKELKNVKKVQWVSEEHAKIKVVELGDLFVDGRFNERSWVERRGLAEPGVATMKKGEFANFERYGFCRMDDPTSMRFILSC